MLVIGAVFVDVKGFAREPYMPEGRNVGDVQLAAGGVCRNVAENLANLGQPVQFVSMVDDNALGREVREGLRALGVDDSYVLCAPRGMGRWLAILDEKGDLAGSISRQPDFTPLQALLEERGEEIVSATDGIVLEFDMNAAIAERVMALAARFEKPVYSIVGNMGVILKHTDYLRHVACFICNEMEAGRLFERDLTRIPPEEMLAVLRPGSAARGISSMVVTMGEQGSVYVDNRTGAFGICPPHSVEVVDTTGAGDAFFSAAVAALMRGEPLARAVELGTDLAARTLGVKGSCTKPH